MRSITTYKKWDIVLLPFPYTDLSSSKRRPTVVISPESYNSGLDIMLLFLTSNLNTDRKEGDYELVQWQEAGLPKPSKTRMKIMTLDKDFVIKKIGEIQSLDKAALKQTLQNFFS
ncbi:MAG: type II toxin-antitoxin system PemK/MazF family toxin [Balneolaceae bacterium]